MRAEDVAPVCLRCLPGVDTRDVHRLIGPVNWANQDSQAQLL